MASASSTRVTALQTILKACVAVMVALVALKFVAILGEFDWDPSKAPWFLLVVVVVPAVVLWILLDRAPRAAAVIIALLLLVFAVTVVMALERDGLARQSWADYPFAYGGLLVAAVGVVNAARLLRSSDRA